MTLSLLPQPNDPRLETLRHCIFMITGLFLTFHETVVMEIERPALLLLGGSLMGVSTMLRKDGKG